MSRQRDMDMKIADNMETYGGGFVKALAECVRRSDSVNLLKLRDAFPQLFSEYHPSNHIKK